MVSTVELKLHLSIEIDKASIPAYGTIRDTDAEAAAMQAAQDYLYQALHGWGGDAAATIFANMEAGTAFQSVVDAAVGTELPIWDEIRPAMNGAIEDFNSKGFGLQFASLPEGTQPTAVRYVRKGKRIYIEYGQDLSVSVGVQDAAKCNVLPLDLTKAVPPVLRALKDAKVVARYRMVAELERNPKS
ncbi:MAG: hypothetical protein H6831_10170 [Planctomycetes bacterium]|nr:hypothetical protein [Planctomycetota bacterium]MCB9904760.1 hypothetical protein [Planctomycetota bacterium]